jgi:hypothetical protein
MDIGGPMAQADHFDGNGTVETFLPRPVHYALTASTDHLQQFIVAKIGKRRWSSRASLAIRRSLIIMAAGIDDAGCRFAHKQIKPGLEQASGAKAFRCVGKNFRSALSTNPWCAAHDGRVGCALPIMYCADFWHTLRSQHAD